jgi:hypothetical protein
VDLVFPTAEMAAACNSKERLRGRYGEATGAVIAQRLAELHAVECLADAADLPQIDISRDGPDVLIDAGGAAQLRARPGPRSVAPTRNRWGIFTQLAISDIKPYNV